MQKPSTTKPSFCSRDSDLSEPWGGYLLCGGGKIGRGTEEEGEEEEEEEGERKPNHEDEAGRERG